MFVASSSLHFDERCQQVECMAHSTPLNVEVPSHCCSRSNLAIAASVGVKRSCLHSRSCNPHALAVILIATGHDLLNHDICADLATDSPGAAAPASPPTAG